MADTVSVFKSQISRTTVEAGAEVIKTLAEKNFHDIELLAVWIDGIQLSQWHDLCIVGAMRKAPSIF